LRKSILFIGGAHEAVPGILRATQLGFSTIVSDQNPLAPGMQQADHCIIADTYDATDTARQALHFHETKRPINGVICMAADVPITVATVAQAISCPSVSIEAAGLTMDKLAMKERFRKDNIPIPWFSAIESLQHLQDIVLQKGFPLVLKPVDSRGARGVFLLTEACKLGELYQASLAHSPSKRVILEQFLSGPQVSTESLFAGKNLFTPGFSDRNYDKMQNFAPHIIEDGGQLPSFLSPAMQESIKNLVQKGAKSLGITTGVVKGDIVVHNDKPYIIELAARLSGGYFCSHEIPLNTGVDFVGCAIRTALGETISPCELRPRFCKGVAERFLFPVPGKVTDIEGIDKVLKWSGVDYCEIRVNREDIIVPTDSHPSRAGVIITTAETREQAVQLAEEAVKNITIITIPT